MKTALTIAGSDSSGGAGIQADIKTMTMHGVYAMSGITAMTAQNTTGVRAIQESTPEFLRQQLDAVFEDIYPDAVKIGMTASSELIRVIADRLRFYGAGNVVVDPVMVASAGSSLIRQDAVQMLIRELLPISTLVTPNIPEAQVLSGMAIKTNEDMITAAKQIGDRYRCAVLLKGGHSVNDANDLLYENGELIWFEGKRIDNPNTHGTGCTLSVRSQPISPGDSPLLKVSKEQRNTSRELWLPCSTWERAVVRLIICTGNNQMLSNAHS